MKTNLWNVIERVDELSPKVSGILVGLALRWASPFNATLRARIERWRPDECRIRVPYRRSLHNHLRTMHAGVIVTAGESAAGLLLLRSFPVKDHRLILKHLSVDYERQAHTPLVAEARLDSARRATLEAGLMLGEAQLAELETVLSEPSGARLAVVRTTWQLKPWAQVSSRMKRPVGASPPAPGRAAGEAEARP